MFDMVLNISLCVDFILKLTKSVFYRFSVCDFLLIPYSLGIILKFHILSFQCVDLVRVSLWFCLWFLHQVLQGFVSVNEKAFSLLHSEITQFADQVKTRRLNSQLIKLFQEFSKNYLSCLIAQLFLDLHYVHYRCCLRTLI